MSILQSLSDISANANNLSGVTDLKVAGTNLANSIGGNLDPFGCGDSSNGLIGHLTSYVISLMDTMGIWGISIGVVLENVVPVIPSEVILPIVGFAAANGTFSIPTAIILSTVIATLGALFWYYIVRAIGMERVLKLCKYIPVISEEDILMSDEWFKKHGRRSVLIGRVIPVIRVLISIPAGLDKMNVFWFSLMTAIGAGAWNTLLILCGFYMGHQWCAIQAVLHKFTIVVIIILVLLFAYYIYHKLSYKKRAAAKTADKKKK
jgi:membrane protein DedA with SNARE-associated domain